VDLKCLYLGSACGDVQCTVQVGIEHDTRCADKTAGTVLPKYTTLVTRSGGIRWVNQNDWNPGILRLVDFDELIQIFF
jgi:hypothetical protein